MSGTGRAIGLGRGRGLIDTVGLRGRGGIGRDAEEIGRGVTEEAALAHRGEVQAISSSRGPDQVRDTALPGTDGASRFGAIRKFNQEKLAYNAEQRGYFDDDSSPDDYEERVRSRAIPRTPPKFEEPRVRGPGMGRGMNIPLKFSSPGSSPVGMKISRKRNSRHLLHQKLQ